MQKKGAELSLNVIIIAVLALIVLVIVAATFLGGWSALKEKLGLSQAIVQGADYNLAIQNCQLWCTEASDLPVDKQKLSSYCVQTQNVDVNRNDKLDDTERDMVCDVENSKPGYDNSLDVSCSNIKCI